METATTKQPQGAREAFIKGGRARENKRASGRGRVARDQKPRTRKALLPVFRRTQEGIWNWSVKIIPAAVMFIFEFLFMVTVLEYEGGELRTPRSVPLAYQY
eukprot:1703067-Rhodomonas_salina.1